MSGNSPHLGLRLLGRNISLTLGRDVLKLIFGVGLGVVLARSLAPEGLGVLAVALLLPTLLMQFLNMGVGAANVYHIARGDVSSGDAFRGNLRVWGIVSTIGLLLGATLVGGWAEEVFPGVPAPYLWALLTTFPISLMASYLVSLLQGKQDFVRFNAVGVVTGGLGLLFACLLVWWLELGIVGAVAANILAAVVGLVVTAWWCREYLNLGRGETLAADYARDAVRYGYKAHLSNMLGFLNYRVDMFLLNLVAGPVPTGLYVIATGMAERIWMLSGSVSTVILPRLSEMHTDEEARLELTPLLARWVFLFTCIGALAMAAIAKLWVWGLYGEVFLSAVLAFYWLLPGVVLTAFARILANDISARGRPELNMYSSIVVVVINVMLNLWLIPTWGIVGAAIATTIAYSGNAVIKTAQYLLLSGNPWWKPFVFTSEDRAIARGFWREARNRLSNGER